MVLYPEVQKRAQKEMDSVLGHGHLPQFEDEDALPYLKAVRHELMRWNPPGPLGQRPITSVRFEMYSPVFIFRYAASSD